MSDPLDVEVIQAYLNGEYLRDGYEAAEDKLYRYCKALMIENTAFRAANAVLSSRLRDALEQRDRNAAWVASESADAARWRMQLEAVPVDDIQSVVAAVVDWANPLMEEHASALVVQEWLDKRGQEACSAS